MTALTVVMTEHEARRVTERIRAIAVTVKDQLEKLQTLLNEARDGEAWRVLGYASWTAYLADVMGEQPLRLPRDERQQIVGYLAGEGMSSRAIAPIVGATDRTVRNDMSGGKDFPPDSEPDYTTDQADIDAATELPDEADFSPANDSGDAEPSEAEVSLSAPARPVTGIDGKQYPRPEPQTPRRSPLPDAFWRAAYDLTKVTERIGRLSEDDRFPQNAEKVAQANLGDLIRARDLLQQVIEQLNN